MEQNTHTQNRSARKRYLRNRSIRRRRRRFVIHLLFIAAAVLCIYLCFRKISGFWKQANNTYAQNEATSTNNPNKSLSDDASDESSSTFELSDTSQIASEGDSSYTTTESSYYISFEGLSQDGIPTGCESVSTVSVLQYWNVDITPDTFILEYLPCQDFWVEDGLTYGPDPDEYFAGVPYDSDSLGCFANVIIKALESLQAQDYPGTSELQFSETNDMSLSDLTETYVSNDIPVIVWVTIDMKASYDGMEYYLEDGTPYVWIAREHCMVLCGYDEENYYLMDPLADGEIVTYEKKLCEQRFEELGQQAVVIK